MAKKKYEPAETLGSLDYILNYLIKKSDSSAVKASLNDSSELSEKEEIAYEAYVVEASCGIMKKQKLPKEQVEAIVREAFSRHTKKTICLILDTPLILGLVPLYWFCFITIIAVIAAAINQPLPNYLLWVFGIYVVSFISCAAFYRLNREKIHERRINKILIQGKQYGF